MTELSESQKYALSLIYNGDNIFLTGVAGTGKSYFVRFIKTMFRDIVITATTGTAAVMLECGAITIYSWIFKDLGEKDESFYINKINNSPIWKNVVKNTKKLIVDEISMFPLELFIKFDKITKAIRKNDKPFGGMQIIITGDFLQLPCVRKRGEERKYIFEFENFKQIFKKAELKENFRQNKDQRFFNLLNNFRVGICTDEDEDLILSRIIDFPADTKIKPTKLFPKKFNVEKINEEELKKLEGDSYEWAHYYSIDNETNINVKKITSALDKFDRNSQHEHILTLKVGAQVMLIKNLDVKNGLCNGSRGVVTEINTFPTVLFLNGDELLIKPEMWIVETIDKNILYRFQVPLKLAWCTTIHKSQGATLDFAYMDLGEDIFEFNQMYVALGRVRCLENLYVKSFNKNHLIADEKVLDWLSTY